MLSYWVIKLSGLFYSRVIFINRYFNTKEIRDAKSSYNMLSILISREEREKQHDV